LRALIAERKFPVVCGGEFISVTGAHGALTEEYLVKDTKSTTKNDCAFCVV
jgi:hypothetical protein